MNVLLRAFCFVLMVIAVGCSRPADKAGHDAGPKVSKSDEKEPAAGESVADNVAKLPPSDRALAQEQKFCAVMTKNLLGSMGVPLKIEINGQPVFLCCDGCETRAKAHADRTLSKVRELKDANAKSPEPK